MRFEHKQIKQHLENIQEYFSKNALPEAYQEEVAIMHLLKMHNMKEEHALYPTIDRMTSVEEKSVIFEKIENKKRREKIRE
jgi:hemerythrin-like domain-containing protein